MLPDRNLRRFWFPIPGHLGIGVSEYSEKRAVDLALDVARKTGWTLDPSLVVSDVDVRTLDQKHVLPNMEAPVWPGVWYPKSFSS